MTVTEVRGSTDSVPVAALTRTVTITPPNFQTLGFTIRGTAPYVQHKFGEKARAQIREKQVAGSTANKGKRREKRNFDADYEQALHKMADGSYGIPAAAFRAAMVSACRTVGFQMTKAKLGFFIEADGIDPSDGTALVKFTKGAPHQFEAYGRNETGVVDLRVRPMWDIGWEAIVRVRFDADMFTPEDIANLLMRVGLQVGIGEGRADSPKSTGLGWGHFELAVDRPGPSG